MALAVRQSVRQQPMEIADRLHIPHWLDQSVREAVQDVKGPLLLATSGPTRLDDVATRTWHAAPDDLARMGFETPPEITEALQKAKRPVVISGPSMHSVAIVQAAANIAWATGAALAYTAPECNSIGLAMMDAPALDAAMKAEAETLIILENDLYRRLPRAEVDRFLSRFRHIVAVDSIETETTARADLVLPASTFAEGDGTFVSNEGRAQRSYQALVPDEPIQESWRWLADWKNLDEAVAELMRAFPHFEAVQRAAPPAGYRIEGAKVAREPSRYSGRTAMLANITVQEPPPPPDPDSPLSFSMEGAWKQPPPPLIPFFWNPGWNSIQSVNKFQSEIGDSLRGGDSGIRMIEPGQSRPEPFREAPPRSEPTPGEWLLVPIHHVFGSEELSRLAPGIAELSPEPYIAVNANAAGTLGNQVEFQGRRIPLKIVPELPDGVAGVPAGIGPFIGLDLPMRAPLTRLP